MVDTVFELMEYLDQRGAPYGISGSDIFNAIPENAREPKVAYEFMQLKDISHIKPLSQGGNPAGDNWLLEDSSVNRARGAETMTSSEIVAAQADNIIDCQQLARVGLTGGAFAGGGLLVEAAAGTVAVAETAALVPTVLTVAAVAGVGVCLFAVGNALFSAFSDD